MKKLAKILVLVLVLTIVVTSLVACGGSTIEISSDGYWVIDGVKTDKKAIGENGINGIDGVTPTIEISADGYWVINGDKTEFKAVEEDENPQGLEFLPLDDGTYAVMGGSSICLTDIVIPSTYKGKAVTRILQQGFYDSHSSRGFSRSITIPNSVTIIGNYGVYTGRDCIIYCEAESKPSGWDNDWNNNYPVVWNCKNNDVATDGYIYTVIDGIRYSLKDGVATVIWQSGAITSINIPASVTYKGNTYAVTSIGDEAFRDCTSLTSIIIPDSVTSIGWHAFYNCTSLTIYCEAESKPDGWDSGWNGSNCPVVWGYNG